jgi:hypothetical protein
MSFVRSTVLAAVLAVTSLASQATTVSLVADGQWNAFDVAELDSLTGGTEWIDANNSLDPAYGSALNFSFTIDAGFVGTLTVVDAAYAGDTFSVFNGAALLGATSSVTPGVYALQADGTVVTPANVGYDFDAALQAPAFSRGVFTLTAGTYRISGLLAQSVSLEDGTPLNATAGAVKLSVSAVPEPSGWALAAAGLGCAVFVTRRRSPR